MTFLPTINNFTNYNLFLSKENQHMPPSSFFFQILVWLSYILPSTRLTVVFRLDPAVSGQDPAIPGQDRLYWPRPG